MKKYTLLANIASLFFRHDICLLVLSSFFFLSFFRFFFILLIILSYVKCMNKRCVNNRLYCANETYSDASTIHISIFEFFRFNDVNDDR